MRWEIYYNDKTRTVTVIDAPLGHEFVPPENVGASIGFIETSPEQKIMIHKGDAFLKVWLTQRFAMLGIEDTVETFDHLPML